MMNPVRRLPEQNVDVTPIIEALCSKPCGIAPCNRPRGVVLPMVDVPIVEAVLEAREAYRRTESVR